MTNPEEFAGEQPVKPGNKYGPPTEGRRRHALRRRVKASPMQMAGGFMKTATQAVRYQNVSEEVRNERYDTCKACDSFIAETKRCSECGCYMEAKTWVGGNKDLLCPLKKWTR